MANNNFNTIDIKSTYNALINYSDFFQRILEYIDNSDVYNNTRKIPKNQYISFLDEYVKCNFYLVGKDKEGYKVKVSLSLENLEYNGLVSITKGDIGSSDIIVLSKHIVEMFKNIYKEYAKILTKTSYKNFLVQIDSMREYFFTHDSLHLKDKELKEHIHETENILNDVEEALRNSILALEYKISHIAFNDNEHKFDFDIQKQKFKIAKELYYSHINPFYDFVNVKYSPFIQELKKLINFLKEEDKLYLFRVKLEDYYKKIILYTGDIKPTRQYISKYLKQTEKEILLNLGTEKLFNEILEYANDGNTGKLNQRTLWAIDKKEVKNMKRFFFNIDNHLRSQNLKFSEINNNIFDRFHEYIIELDTEFEKKQKSKLIQVEEDKRYIEAMKRDKERRIFASNLKELFNKEILETSLEEIISEEKEFTSIVLEFLNTKTDSWVVGDFFDLVFDTFKKRNKEIYFSYGEKTDFIKGNRRAEYSKVYIKKKDLNE